MADITITIPDIRLSRVLDAIAARNGYNPATDGTKAQFARQVLIRWLKRETVDYEVNVAADSAKTTQRTTSESEISIT